MHRARDTSVPGIDTMSAERRTHVPSGMRSVITIVIEIAQAITMRPIARQRSGVRASSSLRNAISRGIMDEERSALEAATWLSVWGMISVQ